MSEQERCSTYDASTRTLIPSSESALHLDDTLVAGSRKRKREGNTVDDLLDEIFIVKPHPSTVFTKPRTLKPVALLPRSHLSLSSIDTTSTSDIIPESRLFEAHVKILELEQRMGNAPMVLIARSEDGKTLFAVEREAQGLYVLCKLGSWVKLNELCAVAVVSRHQSYRGIADGIEVASCMQGAAGESQITPESIKYMKKKRLAIEAIQSMMKRSSKDLSSTSQPTAPVPPQSNTIPEPHSQEQLDGKPTQEDDVVRPMAAEILENIRSQYFETLYLSKASLAYFAKGPLSRARAAFHLDYDATLDMNDLVEFLEGLVLPTTVVDKKYKDGVPDCVASLAMGDGTADEAEKTKSRVKKNKSKKMKPGKNGLYPAEEDFIRRWWSTHDAGAELGVSAGSEEDIAKRRVAQLRIRETQLQMIVILETLALQPLVTSKTDHYGDLPSIGRSSDALDHKARGKSKKPLDLADLVDMHVDRLCIWQSIAAGGGSIAPRTVEDPSLSATSGGLANKYEHAADILREFCVEVIVPFFSARLPEQCSAISRKLGGPVVASPVRPKRTMARSSSGVPSRPGAIAKRAIPSKARRSLQRVLTDERHTRAGSRGPSGAISLMRSATALAVPGLKTEGSEAPLLSSIPSAETQSMLVSRGGVLKSKKFSQREVDLSSLPNGNEAKVKKASIEAELKDAISALKRPNRQLAGQLLIETAERRTASNSMQYRKSKKPIRNPSLKGVQILSTPKGDRHKDTGLDKWPLGSDLLQDCKPSVIPPSSIPRIPQSVARFANARDSEETPLCKATPVRSRSEPKADSAIQATPTQGKAISDSHISNSLINRSFERHGRLPPSSPLQYRHPGKEQLLSIPVPNSRVIEGTPTKAVAVQVTPIKQTNAQNLELDIFSNSVVLKPGSVAIAAMKETGSTDVLRANAREDDSIYKSLGWDDYNDLA